MRFVDATSAVNIGAADIAPRCSLGGLAGNPRRHLAAAHRLSDLIIARRRPMIYPFIRQSSVCLFQRRRCAASVGRVEIWRVEA